MHFAHWLVGCADVVVVSSSSWKGKVLGASDTGAQWVF